MVEKRSISSSAVADGSPLDPKRRGLSTTQSWRRNQSKWSALETKLLERIASKLSYVDIVPMKSVCSSWHPVIESYISSSGYTSRPQAPLLMLPADDQDQDTWCSGLSPPFCSFLNLENKKVYDFKTLGTLLGDNAWCIGSSHGWLVVLDKEADPFLINPFSRQSPIKLPPFSDNVVCRNRVSRSFFVEHLRKQFFGRAVLLSDPSHDEDFVVVLACAHESRLVFCKNGDRSWRFLPNANDDRSTDIFPNSKNRLYVLTMTLGVQEWDFSGPQPVKTAEIPSSTSQMGKSPEYLRNMHLNKYYLVESSGELLLVLRYIADYDSEDDLGAEDSNHPLVYPYRTLMFDVYKMDFKEKTWVEVESLKDRALFLGGNHSLSYSVEDLPGVEGDCIYFTDDNWDQVNEDYLYGGHDNGMFSLRDQTVRSVYERSSVKIDPPPFWIVPNPRRETR